MNTKKYYTKKIVKKIFDSVEKPSWRIWKLIDEDGRCFQSKRQITTPEKLMKFIKLAKNPRALYLSVSMFLSPNKNHGFFANQKIKLKDGTYKYPRAGYIYADCILIDSYFFIDIDDEKDFKNVISDAKKIIKEMGKPFLLQYSGTKGVHILYKMKTKKIADPIKRVKYFKKEKEKLANQLIKLKLKTIDKNHIEIMKNPFAVFAAPHSIKLNNDIVQPFKNKDYLLHFRETREAKANDKNVACAKGDSGETLASQLYRREKGASLTSPPIYFKFVDNKIRGTKNYITVIKKHNKRFKLKEIENLQKEYKLSHFLIVKIGDYTYAYNTKALQFERVIKILRKAKSENLSFFATRKHQPIQITPSYKKNGDLAEEINFIGKLRSAHGLIDNHSRFHSALFGFNFNNLIGEENRTDGLMRIS